jgi:hypothetical protein
MTVPRFPRARAFVGFVAVLLSLGAIIVACGEDRRGIGEDCLRDDDCLSGVCLAQRCAAPPPLTDGSFPTVDAQSDAAGEASDGRDAAETGASNDSGASDSATDEGG